MKVVKAQAGFIQPSSVDTLKNLVSLSSCGLNYTSGSVLLGKRMSVVALPYIGMDQPAPIVISSIPSSAKINSAFLWWDISGKDSVLSVTVQNPVSISKTFAGTLIGRGKPKCWGDYGAAFRADVTSLVSGNGTYFISGLPTDTTFTKSDTNGATLLVIYTDTTSGYTGHIKINDGYLMAKFDTITSTIYNIAVPSGVTSGKAFMLVSDLENEIGTKIKMNGGAYTSITQNFWDFKEKSTVYTLGQESSLFGIQVPNDCSNLIAIGTYYQTSVTSVTPVITQKADTLISSAALTYQWDYNNNHISGSVNKQHIALQSGIYRVIISYSGSNCYFTSAPDTVITCSDRIKPNINRSGNVLTTDSLKYPLQWYVNGKIDTNKISFVDTVTITGNYWVQAYDSISGCVVNSDTVFMNIIGINESVERLLGVSIFPNPSSGELNLTFLDHRLENVQLKIESLAGQLLLDEPVNCKTGVVHKIDISGFSSGMYLLKLIDQQRVITRKILIQNE
ncbi:MAG: T9SS type A sorting domain-containing protein [Bacteroidetes bacterium]|nr:T9SS type A sorting domain-containing protein [Bacteroidota bacterium]